MLILDRLTLAVFALWCLSEIVIGLATRRNRSRSRSDTADRLSYFFVWFSTVPPVGFAMLIRERPAFAHGLGSLSPLFPLLGFWGCFMMVSGIAIRLAAVATLKREFTLKVSILEEHKLIDTGIYGVIRHPAYLGHLVSLLGIGLVSENWVSLAALAVLPLAALLYRIRVEEEALLRHFGPAYQAYASRTKRLLPGVW